MTHDKAFAALQDHQKQSIALGQVAGLIGWDQETMMPEKGAEIRAEQSGAMAGILHERNCDPQIADWCDQIDLAKLDDAGKANVREAKRAYQRATKIPAKLAQELARSAALGQGIWAKARENEKTADFLPTLKAMVALKREEAACLQSDGEEPYDVLLDDYEPGMKTASLATLLGKLRPGLTQLRQQIADTNVTVKPVTGLYDETSQMALARKLASTFNYDWDAGRLDLAVHPFCSGYRGDVRVTTRVAEDDVFNCMYSTIHEVGHANYEQGRDFTMDLTHAGGYASMGVHESQSRMLENQIGRSRAFMEWLYPQMVESFGDFGIASPDELFAIINKVETGFIRTEADEVHYNLHVLMRFELELALIRDELQVSDLEAAWNDRFKADFGRTVDKPSNGVLQDVHWSCGLFGYFPTYSLGNIYAAELFATMSKAIPNINDLIANGDMGKISTWLGDNIHMHGHVYAAPDLIEKAIGKAPDEVALVTYLNDKFGGLYGL